MDNLVNSLITKTIGLTDQQVVNKLLATPNMNDTQMVQFMQGSGISPSQMSRVANIPEQQILARVAATIPQGSSATLGDTVIVPQYRTTGSGMDEQIGPLEGFATSKSNGDPNYKAPVGTPMQMYGANGDFVGTVKTKKDQSFFGGLVDAFKDPVVLAALGGAYAGGLFGGTGAATGAGSAFELANAGAGAFEGGTALNSLAGTGAGSAFEAANAGATAMTDLGASELANAGATAMTDLGASELANAGSTALSDLGASELANAGASANTIGGTTAANAAGTAAGSTLANAAGTAAGTAAGSGVGSALGTTLGQGLALNALGTGLGAIANQSGISNARDLINTYGTQARTALENAYADQKNVYFGNRGDLVANFGTAKGDLANTLSDQRGIYDTTKTDLSNNYENTKTKLGNIYDQQVGFQLPYQEVGKAGSQGLIDNQGYLTRQFNNADLYSNLAPNYQFQLNQGQMANQRAANMGGGSLGGNALRGLQDYTQNYAQGAYQNAFNNFNTQRQNIYSNLAGMANIGTTSAGQLASLGNTYGTNLGSLSSNYGSNMVANAGQMQGAYNQYGGNLTNLNTNYGSNLTNSATAGLQASGQYGTNQANLATGVGGALAGNATASGANTATALNNLGNTALLGSMIKAT